MDIDLDTGRLVAFLTGLAIWILAEQMVLARRPMTPRLPRIALHIGTAAFNTTLMRTLTYVPLLLWLVHVEQQGWGIARWLGLNGWPEFILSVIVLDAFDYFWHRANHRIPLLWRFHKAHHHDNDMDVFTALRFHPGELLVSAFAKALWVVLWGPSVIAWFVFEVLVSFCAQMHHANIDLPDRTETWVRRLLVTPRYHRSHHLVERRFGDNNFATIFPWWDGLFRTRAPDLSGEDIRTRTIGLPEERDLTRSPLELLLEPLRARNTRLVNS